LDAKEQVKQLHAQLEQKQNDINNHLERIQTLGAFQSEALNGREKIASLEAQVEDLERQVAQAARQASDAQSAASAAGNASGANSKKLAAAEDLAKAIKVLLGA
jgi:septal ring factor EnvC (AmiA/AmiB activator)